MKRLTVRGRSEENKSMVWFLDKEDNNRRLEPCEMSSHHSGLAIRKLAKYEEKFEELQEDLTNEIHRLEQLIINKGTSDEDKIKALITLECYSRVLNQMEDM